MIVRAVHLGFEVPEASGAQATIYYPGDESQLDDARLTGLVAADTSGAPWPIVIVMPGINVAPDAYRWLACRLVEAGFCAVTYSAIGSLGPAGTGITPGIDLTALAPDVAGTRCSASAIEPLLAALRLATGPLDGNLDFGSIGLIGHSAGGTVALHNTEPAWIPGLRAVVAYGAHTMTATVLGHDEATVVAIPSKVPILLAAGSNDAVIAASRDRYRSDTGEHDPIRRTFDEGIGRDANDCWLIELVEANHFTLCDPVDETSGRSFLEPDLQADDRSTRELLARLVVCFLEGTLRDAATSLHDLVDDPGVGRWARR